jgi:three-Cys-motif partner protein
MVRPAVVREVEDDGLLAREGQPWALDKLGILEKYDGAFCTACKNTPGWYYVEGFAGPGVNLIRTTVRVAGSPLIALDAAPEFRKCILVERGARSAEALTRRTEVYGARAVVLRGDCNRDLIPLMAEHVNPNAPCLAVLDPEGLELHWSTVEAIAGFKNPGRSKVEQLILLPTNTGFIRLLTVDRDPEPWAVARLDRMFGSDEWRPIYRDRIEGRISPTVARDRYVILYQDRLRGLGYQTVLERAIRSDGWSGAIRYFLIFATDNATGEAIMDSCFQHVEGGDQLTLPGITARRQKYSPD